MGEHAHLLEPGFSVADAEYPSFVLKDGVLVLEFIDWRRHRIRVVFSNAAGVKWQEIELRGPESRNDRTYEITDSAWLRSYLDQGARSVADQLRHFKLCFNAYGPLEVLASSFTFEDAG
jgi:hypothetical protein